MKSLSLDEFIQQIQEKKIIFLYDGICNLCETTVNFFKKRKPDSFRFIDFQSILQNNDIVEKFKLFTDLSAVTTIQMNSKSIQSQEFNQFIVLYKSDAIALCLKELNFPWWPLGYVLQVIPKFIKNFGYDLVAKYRYKLFGKKCGSCDTSSNKQK